MRSVVLPKFLFLFVTASVLAACATEEVSLENAFKEIPEDDLGFLDSDFQRFSYDVGLALLTADATGEPVDETMADDIALAHQIVNDAWRLTPAVERVLGPLLSADQSLNSVGATYALLDAIDNGNLLSEDLLEYGHATFLAFEHAQRGGATPVEGSDEDFSGEGGKDGPSFLVGDSDRGPMDPDRPDPQFGTICNAISSLISSSTTTTTTNPMPVSNPPVVIVNPMPIATAVSVTIPSYTPARDNSDGDSTFCPDAYGGYTISCTADANQANWTAQQPGCPACWAPPANTPCETHGTNHHSCSADPSDPINHPDWHYHYFTVHQAPYPNCTCRTQRHWACCY